nr:c-type cytochrome [uncultured Flavobacterium sp.]
MNSEKQHPEDYKAIAKRLVYLFTSFISLVLTLFFFLLCNDSVSDWVKNNNAETDALYADYEKKAALQNEMASFWKPADINSITDSLLKKEIEYGKELIAHTAKYLGPNGSVKQITNGMNCNNCHLDAGTKPWGNNYGSVNSMYPKMRARSGQIEDITKRINDCLQRSLNGQPLEKEEKEMKAMMAYINYIGSNMTKGEEAKAAGIYNLEYLDRAADPVKGKTLYAAKCASCHQTNGKGVLTADKTEYTYPPLWGDHSYNQGAGLYRISRFAGYIKYNMPLGADYANPQLSDEEAWDIAAYVETQPRPTKDFSKDWPDISKKPVDHPFGPFSDKFTAVQHKFGPFNPIKKAHPKK